MVEIRRLVAAGAAALALGLPAFVPAQANAEGVRVLDSCVATVQDGEQLALQPSAVVQPIIDLLTPLDPLDVLLPAFRETWSGQPPILLPGGQAVITGDVIADAVIQRLHGIPLLSPVINELTGPLQTWLGTTCGVTVVPKPPPGPPPTEGGTPPAAAPVQPGQPGAAEQPGIPVERATMTIVPEYALGSGYGGFGVPGEGALPQDGGESSVGVPQAGADTLAITLARSPGAAEVLPGGTGQGPFNWPAMLAALVLTLVSTQLLRTWVLRHSGD